MWVFELAEKLGKTVAELERDLGDGELTYWFAKELIHPSGERAADLRTGIITSNLFNALVKPDEWICGSQFIPWRRSKPKKKSKKAQARQIDQTFRALAALPAAIFAKNRADAPKGKIVVLASQRSSPQGVS